MQEQQTSSILSKIKESLVTKIFVLGFIVLILLIPYFMFKGLKTDRERRCRSVENELSEKWGKQQTVTAPVLRIPIQTEKTVNGEIKNLNSAFV